MKLKSIAILAASLCLAGCTVTTPSILLYSPSTSLTGNWEITLTSTNHSPAVYPFGIYLTQTGTTVSGIGSWVDKPFPQCIINGIPCAFPYSVLTASLVGTINASGGLVLGTATSTFPGTMTITASTAPTGGTFSGTYSISYGTYVDQGAVSGAMMATLNGTYTGSIKSSVTGFSMGVTTSLTQASTPASGISGAFLGFTGSAALTGSSCISSASVPVSGNFIGNQIGIFLLPASSPTTTILLSGTLSPDTKTMAVTYGITGPCGNDNGSGTLTRQ